VPVLLDGALQIALGYSPANDSFFFFAVLDGAPDPARLDAWALLSQDPAMALRRTRIALDTASHALVMLRDLRATGLVYKNFADALDRFVLDVDAVKGAHNLRSHKGASLPTGTFDEQYLLVRV
jgi:hypothetical protein